MRLAIITTTIAAILGIVVMSVNLGGCESRFRYPCQDPLNWGKSECHDAACRADGSCTEQVLGQLYSAVESNKTEKVFGENSNEEPMATPEPVVEPEKKTLVKAAIKRQIIPESNSDISNSCQVNSCPTHSIEQVEQVEEPLTMNSVVNTREHNLAAN